MSLTVKQIQSAQPKDKPYKLTDIDGLYLYVSQTGYKSWRANYRVAGKQKTTTYGAFPAVSLADARMTHLEARKAKPPEEKTSPVFEDVFREWLKIKQPALSNYKHQLQVENTIKKYAVPKIGQKQISEIKRAELISICRAVQETGAVETAHRVAGRLTAIFDYTQDCGLIEAHPAAGLTRALIPRKVKKPMASISPEKAGELLKSIDTYPDPVTRLGLLLAAHTIVRTGELRLMRWDEFKEDGVIWVVPASRMKLKKPHVVPLSRQSQRLIATLRSHTGEASYAFESPLRPGHPISDHTLLFALYRLGWRGEMTVHGFRALASTVLNEQSPFDREVIERQLAHREKDAVHAAYNRAEYLDKRRDLMQWWSDWLDSQHKVSY
jgi:integrase